METCSPAQLVLVFQSMTGEKDLIRPSESGSHADVLAALGLHCDVKINEQRARNMSVIDVVHCYKTLTI